ncbi:hypothetical protein LTR84_009940 [Exophiala bonariae]|uniref:tRNA pseudouridine(55) synthase n=1 Tax=Exophiala bonariae TaxID=1690606 RepID=A0AAV9NNX2_9EURO|nr:hypothetical protein LTR84_009940 [Exophiala bonariae]
MAESPSKVLEGIFAISKPPNLSSAQVLRDLQHTFAESKVFAPLLAETQRMRVRNDNTRRRRISTDNIFKMGHGGTLDPMATGILIVGIGRGTKHLSEFLECKKTYETVALFGKSTTSYDVAGKVVAEASTDVITKQTVQTQVNQYQGFLKQIPPIYSAIKIDGIKLYDYARSGRELPRELESRDVQVTECTLLDFYEAGQHDFRYPAEEASEEEKLTASKLMKGAEATKKLLAERTPMPKPFENDKAKHNDMPRDQKAALHTHPLPTQEAKPAQAPAARVRLEVSSGFYVRSFVHDLGISCGSFATMAALSRSHQAQYTIADPAPEGLTTALTMDDISAGEDVWGPKITAMLEQWIESHPASQSEENGSLQKHFDGRRDSASNRYSGHRSKRSWDTGGRDHDSKRSKRRNSSSPEA